MLRAEAAEEDEGEGVMAMNDSSGN
jgi:hypothetical protein